MLKTQFTHLIPVFGFTAFLAVPLIAWASTGPMMSVDASDLFEGIEPDIRPEASLALGPIARHIREDVVGHVVIIVHTGHAGSALRNQALSQKRADRIRIALIAWGVAPERLTAIGFGQSQGTRGEGSVDVWTRDKLYN